VLLTAIGGVAALVDGGSAPDGSQLTATAPPTSATTGSTTSVTSTTTSTSTAPPVDSTTSVPGPSSTTTSAPRASVSPRPTTTTIAIPSTTAAPTTTVGTVPPTGIPAGAARVLLVNETDVPLDIAVNQAWLRLGPGQSDEGFIGAELGATNSAPGSDLVVGAIPTNYGLRDEGCGSSQLGQLIAPGHSYRIRFYNSGTCQLLSGGPKPTIAISER
jgi:hypothetical protein